MCHEDEYCEGIDMGTGNCLFGCGRDNLFCLWKPMRRGMGSPPVDHGRFPAQYVRHFDKRLGIVSCPDNMQGDGRRTVFKEYILLIFALSQDGKETLSPCNRRPSIL